MSGDPSYPPIVPHRQRLSAAVFLALALAAASCGSDAAEIAESPAVDSSTAAPEQLETTSTTAPVETSTVPDSTVPVETTTTSTTTPAVSTSPVFTSYEFPDGLIDGRPTQVQGLLGVPEGPGPFPVAIVMHGSHPPCVDDFIPETFNESIVTETLVNLCGTAFPELIRHDIGLGHIVTELNNAGIAAISIDVSSAYVWWGGEPNELETIEQLVTTHFEILTRLNAGEDLGLGLESLSGRLELDAVSVVGHSRTGGHIVSMIEPSSGIPFAPVAVAMVEPLAGPEEAIQREIPILLIRGECDEDVGPDAGRQFLLDVLDPDRLAPATDLFIPAAGHRMLNTGLNGSTCPERGDRLAIQTQAASAVSSFIASAGGQVDLVAGVDATLEALRGDFPSSAEIIELTAFDPQSVPFATSTVGLLPPQPEGADYSDALIEDF